jgi:hypothetical protein
VIVMVSIARPMMMVPSVRSAILMCVILHSALTLPDLDPSALPILPHGL